MACGKLCSPLLVLLSLSLSFVVHGCLSIKFYASTCPSVFPIVKVGIKEAIMNDSRVGASLLRLHFHDCFVNGCDESMLLDGGLNITSGKTAAPNNNSARAFGVVDNIKAKLEQACPRVVSFADILTIAARHSVVYYGGPTWKVRLGRTDSLTANRSAANQFIPSPALYLSGLIKNLKDQGLSFKDMVVLSGGHTIGFAQCVNFRAMHTTTQTSTPPLPSRSARRAPASTTRSCSRWTTKPPSASTPNTTRICWLTRIYSTRTRNSTMGTSFLTLWSKNMPLICVRSLRILPSP